MGINEIDDVSDPVPIDQVADGPAEDKPDRPAQADVGRPQAPSQTINPTETIVEKIANTIGKSRNNEKAAPVFVR